MAGSGERRLEQDATLAFGKPAASETGGKALAGLRVIDLTQFEAGTSCTQLLAWFGAEVLKIEPPGAGEQGRGSTKDKEHTDSFYFMLLNSNKRSVTCNLKSPEGRKNLEALIRISDVFIENYAPGVIERLGFSYDHVRSINPRMVYAQIKGFPPDGPYGRFLAFDPIAQAAGGAVSITGEPDMRPVKPGINVGDTGAGLHCTIGILSALHQRNATGEGQRVEVTMQESTINFARIAYAAQEALGAAAARTANQSIIGGTSPSEVYECAGGGPNDYCYIYTTRSNNTHWHNLLKLIGRTDLIDDERFSTSQSRYKNRDEIDRIVSTWTRKLDKHTAMKLLGEAGVPASAVFDTLELSKDERLRERGMFVELDHVKRGKFVMPGCPIHLSQSPVDITPAPLLGADTVAVYRDLLGMTEDEISELIANNAA